MGKVDIKGALCDLNDNHLFRLLYIQSTAIWNPSINVVVLKNNLFFGIFAKFISFCKYVTYVRTRFLTLAIYECTKKEIANRLSCCFVIA